MWTLGFLILLKNPLVAQTSPNWKAFKSSPQAHRSVDVSDLDTSLLEEAFFHAINQVRQKYKKKPLYYSLPLSEVAQYYSEEQAKLNFFGHNHPYNSEMSTPHKRITQMAGKMNYTGENLAEYPPFQVKKKQGFYYIEEGPDGSITWLDRNKRPLMTHTYFSFAAYITDEWMRSKGHRKNLLNDHYELVGMGFAVPRQRFSKELPMIVITQNFGTQ